MIRLFRVFVPASVVFLLISEAVLIFLCYCAASLFAVEGDPWLFLIYEYGLAQVALVVVCVMIGIYFHDLYWHFKIKSRTLLVSQICLVLGIAFLLEALLDYLKLSHLILPKLMMIWGSAFVFVFLPAWRIFYEKFVSPAVGSHKILFLGTSPVAQEIAAQAQEQPHLGIVTLGYLDSALPVGSEVPGGTVLGSIADLRAIVAELKPDRIVVGMSERRERLPVEELLDLRFSGIHIEDAQNTYESAFGRICTRELRPSQLIFSRDLGPSRKSVVWQSVYSFMLGLVGTIVAAPAMLLVAVLLKMTSRGPMLYRQRRVGRDGAVFMVNKFRSMYVDAEARTGAVWASKDDPRITPLGKWLRKLRLDELPQLFNVLRGEMAIVGPRPERPEFVNTLAEKIPYYRQRLCVKPGITGWAQINHKYGDTLEDTIVKLEYDLYYIKNLAFSLDAYIMFQTIKVMLLQRGAQ